MVYTLSNPVDRTKEEEVDRVAEASKEKEVNRVAREFKGGKWAREVAEKVLGAAVAVPELYDAFVCRVPGLEVVVDAVPFAQVVHKSLETINEFINTYTEVCEAAKSLPESLKRCHDIVVGLWSKVPDDYEGEFERVAKGCLELVLRIEGRCHKWQNKNWFKKAWGVEKYKAEFEGYQKQSVVYRLDVLTSFQRVLDEKAEHRHTDTTQALSEVQLTAEKVLEAVETMTEHTPALLEQMDAKQADRHDEIIQMIKSASTPEDKVPPSILPNVPHLFGRESELEELDKELAGCGTMAALLGIPGAGKSHCAKKFLQTWVKQNKSIRFAFWLTAETEASLRLDYMEVMRRLGIELNLEDRDGVDTSELAGRIWKRLGDLPAQFEWLLVFDNVPEIVNGREGLDPFLKWFFPEQSLKHWGNGRVLFTSRLQTFGGASFLEETTVIHVTPLKKEPAVDMLLRKVLPSGASQELIADSKDAAAELVISELGGLPLAIAAAGGQILDMPHMTVRQYLEELKLGAVTGVHDKVKKALKNAVDHARETGLGGVLDIVAYADPDAITAELLGNDQNAIERLCKLSLLLLVETNVYSMHRTTQEVARDYCRPCAAIRAIKAAFSRFGIDDSDTWHVGIEMVGHVEALESLLEKEGGPSKSLGAIDDLYAFVRIINYSGLVFYLALNDFRACRQKYEKVLELIECVRSGFENDGNDQGEENLEFDGELRLFSCEEWNWLRAVVLNSLGSLYRDIGEYENSQDKLEEALDMFKHMYGVDAKNVHVARTLRSLGKLYRDLGQYNKARETLEDSLDMYRHLCPDAKSVHVARTLGSLGELYRDLGEYETARGKLEEALEMFRHVYGPDAKNVNLAWVLRSLGKLYRDVGEYESARAKLEESLDIFRHVYGPNAKNVDVACALGSLGKLDRDVGAYENARHNLEESLDMFRNVYGPDTENVNVAWALRSLGKFYRDVGEYESARAKLEKSLDMFKHVCPDAKNVNVAWALRTLGKLYRRVGEYDEAQVKLEEALNMFRHVYGNDAENVHLARTLGGFGGLHRDLGEYDKARDELAKSLDMFRHIYGLETKNLDVAEALASLGKLYRDLGEYNEAQGKLEKACDMYNEAQGKLEEARDMYRHLYGRGAKNVNMVRTLDCDLDKLPLLILVDDLLRPFIVT